jgi:aryl-alcohol dehydrogenase-like predicted oxidoreductase
MLLDLFGMPPAARLRGEVLLVIPGEQVGGASTKPEPPVAIVSLRERRAFFRFTMPFMKYRKFGRAGFEVSDIGHGLWGMGGWMDSDDHESFEALELAVHLGCNFFDSAWAYGDGKSDALLGQTIARNQGKRLYAASKIPPKNQRWPALPKFKYHDVFPPEHVFRYCDLIRRQLGVDSIDLLQFHVWDDHWTDEPDFQNTVQKLKQDGAVRLFGLSLNRWEPENGLRAIQTGLVDAVQVIYSVFDQSPEDRLFPLCQELNLGVIVRVALDEGSLSGKMTKETRFPPGDWRARYFNSRNLVNTLKRVEKLRQILPAGMSLPEMALRFVLSHPAVSTTIVGMRKPEHVRENAAVSDKGPLDPELLRELKRHRWDRKPRPWSD